MLSEYDELPYSADSCPESSGNESEHSDSAGGSKHSSAANGRRQMTFCTGSMLSSLSDKELVLGYRESDHSKAYISELICRYFPMIKARAAALSRSADSADDFVQEGLMGFLSAVRHYNTERATPFSTFAYTCVINRMRKAAARFAGESGGDEILPEDAVDDTHMPEKVFFERELLTELKGFLTEREYEVLCLFMVDMSYKEIAVRLGISVKAADNAVQRARKKLRAVYDGKGFDSCQSVSKDGGYPANNAKSGSPQNTAE